MDNTKSSVKIITTNEAKLLIFVFFNSFTFLYHFSNMMFMDFGVDPVGISILLNTLQFAKIMVDVPIGVMSDRFDKKKVLILAESCKLAFVLLWVFHKSMFTFVLGMALWGVSFSYATGAMEAYVYCIQKFEGREDRFGVFIGRYYALWTGAIALATYTGGVLSKRGSYDVLLLTSAVFILISLFVASTLPSSKPENIEIRTSQKSLIEKIRIAILPLKEAFMDKTIILYVTMSALASGVFMCLFDLNTILMYNMGFIQTEVANTSSVVATIKIFTNFVAGDIVNRYKVDVKKAIIFHLGAFLILALSTIGYNVHSVFWLVTLNPVIISISCILIGFSFFDVALKVQIQKVVRHDARSIVLSSVSFGSSLLVLFLNFIFSGMMAKYTSYRIATLFLGLCIALFCSILLTMFFRIKSKQNQKFVPDLC